METESITERITESESITEPKRKLASIQEVTEVIKHPNADALELATVLGWQVVTSVDRKENTHEAIVGDKIIYCEIDSLLPGDAEWLPPAVRCRVEKQKDQTWYRIKSIKIRKELSQGLIVPIVKSISHMREYDVGTDVTEELKIAKFEPPITVVGEESSGIKFPSHLVPKTEELRVQSEPELFRSIQNQKYYITVKLDGTSGTFLRDPADDELICCSRNLVRPKPILREGMDWKLLDNRYRYWKMALRYSLDSKLRETPHFAIQGEICGPGIQKNPLNLRELDFFVFNIVDMRNRQSLPYDQLVETCKKLGLKMVPVEEVGDKFECDDIKTLLKKAEGKYKNTKNQREGIVIRSQNQDISFKAISNVYLLKHGY